MLAKMKLSARFLVLFSLFLTNSQAQQSVEKVESNNKTAVQKVSPEKQALIKELLVVLDAKKNSEAMLNATFDQTEKAMPDLIWQAISKM